MNTEAERGRGIAFLLPNGETLQEDVPWQVAGALLGVPADRLTEQIHVHEVRLLEDGFSLAVDAEGGLWQTILFTPRVFNHYRRSILSRPELEPNDSIEASNLLLLFVAAGNNLVASIARKRIEEGAFCFDDAREDLPEVFRDQGFRDFFTESYVSRDHLLSRKGKRSQFHAGAIELYELAVSFIAKTPGMSWDAACEKAVERGHDLVPKSWQSDPVGNLKRETNRKLEHSKWSLSGWRKPQDK